MAEQFGLLDGGEHVVGVSVDQRLRDGILPGVAGRGQQRAQGSEKVRARLRRVVEAVCCGAQ
ncbi:MAG: hypothetical protein GEV09_15310 [Pseudonocardiaceae bacterium]|nr:hypothetical protein [Pseudonocardiaceae bacterium]